MNCIFCKNLKMVDDYYSFKQDLLIQTRCFSEKDVRELVREYADIIASNRRSSLINGIKELILVLEKRDHVCSNDYSKLQNIVNRLPAEEKSKMLARLNNRRTVEYGDYSNNNGPLNVPPHSSVHNPQSSSSNNDTLPSCVLDLISNEIGIKWRDFARKLCLREGDLISIENKCRNDFRLCAYESLVLFQSRSIKQNMRRNLLQALEKARRKDLQHSVEELFDNMN